MIREQGRRGDWSGRWPRSRGCKTLFPETDLTAQDHPEVEVMAGRAVGDVLAAGTHVLVRGQEGKRAHLNGRIAIVENNYVTGGDLFYRVFLYSYVTSNQRPINDKVRREFHDGAFHKVCRDRQQQQAIWLEPSGLMPLRGEQGPSSMSCPECKAVQFLRKRATGHSALLRCKVCEPPPVWPTKHWRPGFRDERKHSWRPTTAELLKPKSMPKMPPETRKGTRPSTAPGRPATKAAPMRHVP